jgi:hypothetical protein
MGLRLSRHLGPVESLDRGQWTDRTASGEPALSCPHCARVQDVRHEVTAHGVVLLRWMCEAPSCSFLDWLTLDSFAMEEAA